MITTLSQRLASESSESILAALEAALKRSEEAPFWASKVMPLAQAVLSALIPLREQQLLISPEGAHQTTLTPELFLRWCDMMCLKHLYFLLHKSNERGALQATGVSTDAAATYHPVDLTILGNYLSGYSVDLHNEFVDFPITHYNLHIGISGVIKGIL